MANRVLLGNHGTYGYGAYVSGHNIDVTGANRDTFLMDTAAVSNGQILFVKKVTASANQNVTQAFAVPARPIIFAYTAFGTGEHTTSGGSTANYVKGCGSFTTFDVSKLVVYFSSSTGYVLLNNASYGTAVTAYIMVMKEPG